MLFWWEKNRYLETKGVFDQPPPGGPLPNGKGTGIKVGLGIWEFRAISRRLISKIRFPHPISVADATCGTRFDLRDSKRQALEN